MKEIKNRRGRQGNDSLKKENEYLHRSSKYNIAQIFSFVNDFDLIRYIPNEFLNQSQIEIKKKAIEETIKIN